MRGAGWKYPIIILYRHIDIAVFSFLHCEEEEGKHIRDGNHSHTSSFLIRAYHPLNLQHNERPQSMRVECTLLSLMPTYTSSSKRRNYVTQRLVAETCN